MAEEKPVRSRSRTLRLALFAVAAVVLLVVGAAAVVIARFDPNEQKPRIIAAVKQATGRDLTLNGPIRLAWSLQPTIEALDVALSNPPGFSRPQMMTLERMELRLALLPLLSRTVDIQRLVLVNPDIRLEVNDKGVPNWTFSRERHAGVTPASGGGSAQAAEHPDPLVQFNEIAILGGTVAYQEGKAAEPLTVTIKQATASATSARSPIHLTADVVHRGVPLSLVADTGSLARLQDDTASSPWPVKLTVESQGSRASAEGSLTRPLQAKGYTMAVSAAIRDLAAFNPLLPDTKLPPLHDIAVQASATDKGAPWPDLTQVRLRVGASDLDAVRPGLRLDSLELAAPAADQPVTVDAKAQLNDKPISLAGTVGHPLMLLRAQPAGPYPIDLTLKSAAASVTAKGAIAKPKSLEGAAINLAASVPDLAALSWLSPRPLPPIKDIAFSGKVTDTAGGLTSGAALRDIRLTMPQGDLAGTASITLDPRERLTANLTSQRIDLDALLAAMEDATPAQPAAPSDSAAAPAPARAPRQTTDRLFPDQPLPLGALRGHDADVHLRVGVLRAGSADYKSLDAKLVLANGRLTLDPLTAQAPAGTMDVKLTVDAAQPTPPVTLSLRAPDVAVRPLLLALGERPFATGRMEVYADLRGAGASPHAIAASLDGTAGLAMAGGSFNTAQLGSLLGKVASQANILELIGRGERNSEIRCIAARMDASNGIATIQPLLLSSSLLTASGGGTVNLRDETLALTVRPEGRVGGTGFSVPVRISGPLRSPTAEVDAAATAGANAGTVAGIVIGNNPQLGPLADALGAADKLLGGNGPTGSQAGTCPTALATARGHAPPTEAAQAPAPRPRTESGSQPQPPDPAALLRQLFR